MHDHSYFSKGESHGTQTKKQKVTCCMRGCSNSNSDHVMFHFPKLLNLAYGQKVINKRNFERLVWGLNGENNIVYL